jgi:hypothetical protein
MKRPALVHHLIRHFNLRFSYLPLPAAPLWMASRNLDTLIEPPTWLGGYSLNVPRYLSSNEESLQHRIELN